MSVDRVVRYMAPAVLGLFLACPCAHGGGRSNRPDLTPLMNAVANNDLHLVNQLIAKDADVRQRTKQGETALYEAIEHRQYNNDNLPVVEALLKAGADPNEVEMFEMSALQVSLTRDYGNPEVTLLLLRAGARVPQTCGKGDSVLALATMDSSPEVIHALLEAGAPVNCRGTHGETALFWAALNGQVDRVAILLKGGADPTIPNENGKTPLDVATTTNPERRVQELFARTRELLSSAVKKLDFQRLSQRNRWWHLQFLLTRTMKSHLRLKCPLIFLMDT
jgi:ankyrin repeat protein